MAFKSISLATIALVLSTSVNAALIYQWESSGGSSATGSITLNENILVGNTFDPLTDIALFDFNVNGTDYGIDAFYTGNAVWEAGTLRLCAPNCDTTRFVKSAGVPIPAGQSILFRVTNTQQGNTKIYDHEWSFSAKDGLGASFTGNGDWVSVTAVPAPSALILFLSGIGMLSAVNRRFGKRKS